MTCLAGMISIFHLHNTLNYPNTNVNKNINKNKFVTINKNSNTAPVQAKIVKFWWMMESAFSYIPPRNKNFSMHTPWDKNFLLSKNQKFSKNQK